MWKKKENKKKNIIHFFLDPLSKGIHLIQKQTKIKISKVLPSKAQSKET